MFNNSLILISVNPNLAYFKEERNNSFIFRGSRKHLEYWLNYSLPIVLVIYNKDINLAYWEEISKLTISLTNKSFKILIPKNNILSNRSKEKLAEIAFFKNKYDYKIWQLQNSINEIRTLINQELFLYIEIEDSHPNQFITLLITNEDKDDSAEMIHRMFDANPIRFYYHLLLSEDASLEEALKDTLPWADFILNNSIFSDRKLVKYIKKDIFQYEFSQDFAEISMLKSENNYFRLAVFLTDSYCFKLKLQHNELSHAVLKLNSFLNKEPSVKQRISI